MTTINHILEILGNPEHVKIENGAFMPLSIEKIGQGPHNLPAISVCHYGEQNGDLMRDPEMCFEVTPDGKFHPYYFCNDYVGLEQDVYFRTEDGREMIRPRLKNELSAFARQWSANLREQGFIKAARRQARPVLAIAA